MDGEHVRATVLFCDIRGFTPLTSKLTPRQVRTLLDIYYDVLSHVILGHGGTTLRYTGDEIYAVFGAPNPSTDHETVGVETAIAMHAALPEINRRLAEAGIPPLDFGIGMHTGDLVSTVVGSAVRRQYAVIGNSVNMGARLCAQAKAGEIVVSEVTFGALQFDTSGWEPYQAELKGIEGTPTLYRFHVAVAEPSYITMRWSDPHPLSELSPG